MPASLHQSSERLSVLEDATHDPTVFTGWTVASADDLDRASLAAALELLAGRGRPRLFRILVRERSLSHRVEPWTANVGGNVLAGVTFDLSSRASVDRARRFLDGSIKQLRLVGPSRGEVDRARSRLELDALFRWEDLRTRARDLALSELEAGDAGALARRAASLDAVSPETIRHLAHDHFVEGARTTVEVYPPLFPYDDPRLLRHAMYTVAAGDTLAAIALRFHSSVAAIARANDLDPKYSLAVGQGLWIPPE
jgi:predicted Zn-dependent peptidase